MGRKRSSSVGRSRRPSTTLWAVCRTAGLICVGLLLGATVFYLGILRRAAAPARPLAEAPIYTTPLLTTEDAAAAPPAALPAAPSSTSSSFSSLPQLPCVDEAAGPAALFEVTQLVAAAPSLTGAAWTAEIRPRACVCAQRPTPSGAAAACTGAAAFAAWLHAPGVTAAGTVVQNGSSALWTVTVRPPPFAGAYTVDVLLEFYNVPTLYKDYKDRKEWQAQAGPLAPRYWYAAVSSQTIRVADGSSAGARPAAEPWCRGGDVSGYWLGERPGRRRFYAHGCRLRRWAKASGPALDPWPAGLTASDNATLAACDAYEASPEARADLAARLRGRWLALFGDSNTTHMFRLLCQWLGAAPLARAATDKDPEPEESVCLTGTALVTLSIWWGSRSPLLTQRIRWDMQTVATRARVASDALAPWLERAAPDVAAISLGSHDQHACEAQAAPALDMLAVAGWLPRRPADASAVCSELNGPRLRFMSTAPTDVRLMETRLPPNLARLSELQNNPRIERTNAALRRTLPGCAFVDVYAVRAGAQMAGWNSDPVHAADDVAGATVDALLNSL